MKQTKPHFFRRDGKWVCRSIHGVLGEGSTPQKAQENQRARAKAIAQILREVGKI